MLYTSWSEIYIPTQSKLKRYVNQFTMYNYNIFIAKLKIKQTSDE